MPGLHAVPRSNERVGTHRAGDQAARRAQQCFRPHPAFIDEALFFPFAPHDDLLDACARIYDRQPAPASKWERTEWEPPVYPDA